MPACPTCGTELTPKNKLLLFGVGLGMVAMAGLVATLREGWFLLPVGALAIVGAYLVLWATRGKALWCRTCKKAPFLIA